MRELTEADAGGVSAVGVGEEVVLRLPENRTTGYRWRLDVPPEGFVVADDEWSAAAPGRPGAGGIRTLRLRATAPGEHRVAAALRRSWESADDAGTRVEFRFRVR